MSFLLWAVCEAQDLRGNGGGAFQTALGIAGLFMDNKVITYVVRACVIAYVADTML